MKCMNCGKKASFRLKVWYLNGQKYCEHDEFEKKLDATDKRLNQAVRQGKMENKPIDNLRSYKENDGWHYKYV